MRAACVAFCLALASPALADAATPDEDKPAKPFSVVAMPIPDSNPAIGNGLAVAALGIYTHDKAAPPWVTGVGGMYADSRSWAAFAGQQANLRHDAVRLTLGGGVGDFHLDFYGIGAGAGDRNHAIPIDQKGGGVLAEALFRVRPHTYLGVRYRGVAVKTTLDLSELPYPDLTLPQVELDSASSALGLAAEYDTRDSQFGPREGAYVTAQWLLAGSALGSDFDYDRLQLAANAYRPLTDKAVVAARLSVCDSG
ncbi:MAG: BamA/TamA family outer membrane protein, partial [Phenylobacterium sp.]